MSDKVVVMSDGMIQQTGTPEEIYNEPKNAFVADFIGESNIFEGWMAASMTVKFLGFPFPCVDNVPRDTRVDVVVRPEDVLITTPEKGQITGVVDSSVFKGMYYEITALLEGDNEVVIQSTRSARVGDRIGMCIEPDGIHVMPAGVLVNVFDGEITKDGAVWHLPAEITSATLRSCMRAPGREKTHPSLRRRARRSAWPACR